APGEIVEVAGYASTEFKPVLVDAEYRRAGFGPAVEPLRIDASDLIRNIPNGKLVTIDAQVLHAETQHVDTNIEHHLVLQANGAIFEALLPQAPGAKFDMAKGSVVRVNGINSVQTDRWQKSRTFQLLLRDARDLAVLVAPPRFTVRNAARLGV